MNKIQVKKAMDALKKFSKSEKQPLPGGRTQGNANFPTPDRPPFGRGTPLQAQPKRPSLIRRDEYYATNYGPYDYLPRPHSAPFDSSPGAERLNDRRDIGARVELDKRLKESSILATRASAKAFKGRHETHERSKEHTAHLKKFDDSQRAIQGYKADIKCNRQETEKRKESYIKKYHRG